MPVLAGAGAANAAPLAFDPGVARQGTTLVVTADQSALWPGGQTARSITFALPRGMRVDAASRDQLCARRAAVRLACPEESRIGFGRFSLNVGGYVLGSGATQLAWAIDAFLGEPERRTDAASVVLTSKLLGADLVGALLTPSLGTTVPATETTIGRLITPHSGAYGVELQFPKLPAALTVAPPITATPAELDLTLGAVRRVRQNFTRRLRIKTPTGYEIRRIHDHRLIGHYLLRTPSTCKGSWRSELRVELPSGPRRMVSRIDCTNTLTAASVDPA